MPYEQNPDEIGVLWQKTSAKGTEFMSGKINGVDVVCFRADKKSEKSPDWRVLKSKPRDNSGEPRRDTQRRTFRTSAPPVDDEIGF